MEMIIVKFFLGDWKNALRFNIPIWSILLLLFWFLYANGLYPQGVNVLPNRGLSSGLLINLVGAKYFVLTYILVSTPLQEWLFRVIAINNLEKYLKSKRLVIFISALIFSLAHIYYPKPFDILLGTFIMGVYLGLDYYKHRSFLTLWISHGLIGMLAFILNLA
jgi:membrane protease YdiL (CAAX protease family)